MNFHVWCWTIVPVLLAYWDETEPVGVRKIDGSHRVPTTP